MKKTNLIFLLVLFGMFILPMAGAVCVVPIQHKIVIDNIKEFSDYVFIAHLSDGDTRTPHYDYIIFNSKEVPYKKDDRTLILKEVYVIKKSDFKEVNKTVIVRKMDTCGNFIIDNEPNNTCNVSAYSINGASYEYPYNFEIDSDFTKLSLAKQNLEGKECADIKMPDTREDHIKLNIENGRLKATSDYAIYYYPNKNITKKVYPNSNGSFELIKLSDNEINPSIKEGFFTKILNWFKRLFG